MKASIKHKDLSKKLYTKEKCYIIEISNSFDDPAVSIAQARIETGVTTNWHRLKGTSERYCFKWAWTSGSWRVAGATGESG